MYKKIDQFRSYIMKLGGWDLFGWLLPSPGLVMFDVGLSSQRDIEILITEASNLSRVMN
jgi:hypothetical protein